MYEKNKLSRFEALLIAAIVVMASFFVILALEYPRQATAHRDDALMTNTALSVARVNSNHGTGCVVSDCKGGSCPHRHGKSTIGYLDTMSNTIVGTRTKGYNEESRIRLKGKVYRGKPGTLIIEAKADENGNVSLSWVKGRMR